jgi:transposase
LHNNVGSALDRRWIIGTTTRFECGKQIGTYVEIIPREKFSARKQRLGHISKQGNSLLRLVGGSSPSRSACSS